MPDTPGTAVRPPRLYLGALLAGILLDNIVPLASALPLWPRLAGLLPLEQFIFALNRPILIVVVAGLDPATQHRARKPLESLAAGCPGRARARRGKNDQDDSTKTAIALAAGAALLAWGIRCFSAAGTNVPTVKPTTALVTVGPYRFSRNPIYVGLTAIYFGLALLAASWWALLLVFPVLFVMEFGVIRREERYLEAKFGDAYRNYRRTVRRWV